MVNVENEIQKYIIVTESKKISKTILKAISSMNSKKRYVQLFWEQKLVYNPTKHELSPKYYLMKEKDEINKFLKRNRLKIINLPQQNIKGVISQYYDAKNNNIFKITSVSETAGKRIFYRRVCYL